MDVKSCLCVFFSSFPLLLFLPIRPVYSIPIPTLDLQPTTQNNLNPINISIMDANKKKKSSPKNSSQPSQPI